jgi:hypothetical protein
MGWLVNGTGKDHNPHRCRKTRCREQRCKDHRCGEADAKAAAGAMVRQAFDEGWNTGYQQGMAVGSS